jgi:DNA-binding MarR family transcriptional regulator
MAYLSGAGAADFNELKAKVGGTDGNLSVHIRKLEDAGYVKVEKAFAGRKPQTTCQLTAKGRRAWIAYIERMEALMRPNAAE